MIPDMPRKLREQVRREAYLANEIILKTELKIARGAKGNLTDDEMTGIRRRMNDLVLRARSQKEKPEGNEHDHDHDHGHSHDPEDESPV